MAQLTFSRKEKKYLMNQAQYQTLLSHIQPYLVADRYAQYTICNTYYDTPSFDLIRRSIDKTDKPDYKEKLRVRSYGAIGEEDICFLELKKKYKGIVYKRRLELPYRVVQQILDGVPNTDVPACTQVQILREIQAFCNLHHPRPALFLAYDREAYTAKEAPDLRITFDRRIRYRWQSVDLHSDHGELLLPEDAVLLEIKLPVSMPLWLVRGLQAAEVVPTSFSKYGEIYKKKLQQDMSAWMQMQKGTQYETV